jgi:flagellar hook assembly protein FlgD
VVPAAGGRLHSAQPNPFRVATTLRFDVPAAGARVRLEVFDTNGRRVARLADGVVAGGAQIVRWLGNDESGQQVPAGVYLCRLEGVGAPQTAKVLRVR